MNDNQAFAIAFWLLAIPTFLFTSNAIIAAIVGFVGAILMMFFAAFLVMITGGNGKDYLVAYLFVLAFVAYFLISTAMKLSNNPS